MDDLDGFEVLQEINADPATSQIPVIVRTSKPLTAGERQRLTPWAVAILSKSDPPEKTAEALKTAGVAVNAVREAHHA